MKGTGSDTEAVDCALELLLEQCSEETVEEERVRRVLRPVLRMIEDGRFSSIGGVPE